MKYFPLDAAGSRHSGYQQQVKEGNIKRIFDLVRSGKCRSRAELVRVMNLSATSVSVLVEELAARRLIDETGPTHTSLPGRRPINLRLNNSAHQIVVFTIQREGIRYTLLDLNCKILESLFFELDPSRFCDPDNMEQNDQLVEDILNHRAKLYNHDRALFLGLCFPGVYLKEERKLSMLSTLGIVMSENAIYRLQECLRLPVFVLNDTVCLAYAEKKLLDAANTQDLETLDLVYVEMRKRVSSATIAKGDIYTGPYNNAGQIGHTTIDYNGRPCHCGNVGCLERYVNLDAILEDAQQACREAGVQAPQSFEELARRYLDEPALLASVNRSAQLLAFGLYSLLCSSGMRRVVLGGGIEALGEPFLKEVYRAVMSRSMLVHHLDLSYAQAGPDAESVGIAQYFLDKVFTITA